MTGADTSRSAGAMMSDIMGNVANLVRNEADLARAEIAESMTRAVASIAVMGLALALAIAALNLIAASLVLFAIWAGLPPEWAPVVVGLGLLLIAWAIFSAAKSALNQIGFVPTRAARSVQRDAAVIKESFNEK